MAEFETKLRWLSERGNPVGAEELIERIEAELAGDPLVVVAKRREGTTMTKTQQPPTTGQPSRFKGPVWALAAFAVILAVGGLYFAFIGDDGQVVDQTTVPTPTTVLTIAPNPTRLQQVGDRPPGPLDPGAYFVDADTEPSTTAGGTFVIESAGWIGAEEGVYRQNPKGPDHRWAVSLWVYQVAAPYAPSCDFTAPAPMPAGSTAADLADAFAASGFTVREAPAPVSAFGHDGYHVVVEVPEGCDDAMGSMRNIFLRSGDVMEEWIFDMDGHIVLVDANWLVESSEEDLAELRAVIDTLVLTP